MKKLLSLCLILLTVLLCTGCGESNPLADEKYGKNYKVDVREITVDNNGQKIWGEAYIPDTGGKVPLVLTSHGLGTNHNTGAAYAELLAQKGYAFYTWDFRGGTSEDRENRSDGSSLDMSVMTEVSDVEAILKAAKTWDFVDTDRIFLLGCSQGGLVTAIAGVRHEDEVAGLILCYPAFGMTRLGERYSEDMPEENDLGNITVGRRFFKDLSGYDVRDDIPDFDKPVIIIQGSKDDLVLPETVEAASKLYPDCEYHVIEGAEHGFSDQYLTEAAVTALEFLQKHT